MPVCPDSPNPIIVIDHTFSRPFLTASPKTQSPIIPTFSILSGGQLRIEFPIGIMTDELNVRGIAVQGIQISHDENDVPESSDMIRTHQHRIPPVNMPPNFSNGLIDMNHLQNMKLHRVKIFFQPPLHILI